MDEWKIMFKVFGSSHKRDRMVRRSFVQAGALGVGGLTLPDFLSLRPSVSDAQAAVRIDQAKTSVILIWMSGGPGHHETWDPKPNALDQFRGPFGAISTSVPGVQFSEMLPEQSEVAEHLAVLRTV